MLLDISVFYQKVVDGFSIQLQISERSSATAVVSAIEDASKSLQNSDRSETSIDLSKITRKLTVRNLSFQASKTDLQQLFSVGFHRVILFQVLSVVLS